MNNDIIVKAEYVIALETNTITDEIRNNYIQIINKNADEPVDGFESIVNYVLKSLENKTMFPNEAFELIKNEYSMLNLPTFLGDFDIYNEFINLLIDSKITLDKGIDLIKLKEFINVADNLPSEFKNSIYLIVLRCLTNSNYIIEDLNFSQKVIAHVKTFNVDVHGTMYFQDVIHKVLNSISFN